MGWLKRRLGYWRCYQCGEVENAFATKYFAKVKPDMATTLKEVTICEHCLRLF